MRHHEGQVLLRLASGAGFADPLAAVRAPRRQWHIDDLVDVARRLTMVVTPLPATRARARRLRLRVGAPFENGGARRLPARCAAANAWVRRSISRRNRSRSRSSRAFSSRNCSLRSRNSSFSRRSRSVASSRSFVDGRGVRAQVRHRYARVATKVQAVALRLDRSSAGTAASELWAPLCRFR